MQEKSTSRLPKNKISLAQSETLWLILPLEIRHNI
jgi:hypothetical protein